MEFQEYKYRWVILLLYCLAEAMNAMVWITCSSITSVISKTYDVSTFAVALCSLVYMIAYIPLVFPSNYILDTYGLKAGTIIGIGITTLGAWVHVGAYDNFWCILVGSILGGIGQPFLLNAPAKLAAFWFRPNTRAIATTIGSVSNPIGIAIGFGLPGIIVTSSKSKEEIGNLMLVEACLSTAVCISCIIFFKSKPKTPPSSSADMKREEFLPSMKQLFKNKNFNMLFIFFAMGQGALNAFATLLDQISKPYGFSSSDNSLFGALVIIFGLVGSAIAGGIVATTQRYRISCLVIAFGSLGGIVAFLAVLPLESTLWSAIFASVLGLLLMPILPVSFEFVCEVTFPIGEAMTGGFLNWGGQIVGIAEVGLSYLLSNQAIIVGIICSSGILLGGLCMVFVKQDLRRSSQDKVHNSNKEMQYEGVVSMLSGEYTH